jgi:hypothetical protein
VVGIKIMRSIVATLGTVGKIRVGFVPVLAYNVLPFPA